jgi:ubiquitin carboxyl-terminal hydrolase 17
VIHLPRSIANWGRDTPDKVNQPWHNADRLLTSQDLVNTGQLCRQEGRRRSKKGKNKNKQGQKLLLVR